MSVESVEIIVNGIKSTVPAEPSINYELLCKLAVQPSRYTPTITYVIDGFITSQLRPGEEAPLIAGAKYDVRITGNFNKK